MDKPYPVITAEGAAKLANTYKRALAENRKLAARVPEMMADYILQMAVDSNRAARVVDAVRPLTIDPTDWPALRKLIDDYDVGAKP